MKEQKTTPSRCFLRFFRWFCHPDYREDIEGDLMERFEGKLEEKGIKAAKWGFIKDVIQLFRPGIIRSLEGNYRLNQYGMFKNYFKTSYRSILHNKLFTTINILGLAVSMAVGFLMISFISDLMSYDNFQEKKDRIYRITTQDKHDEGWSSNLASTSVKAAYEIRQSVSGIEDLTVVRRGFGGDAEMNGRKIPLQGFWADNSFFSVFTYPLLYGDYETALKEPYSLVLTEKTAKKLFGKTDIIGEAVMFDTLGYVVTGVLKDIPKLSHLQFQALVSFSTEELRRSGNKGQSFSWESIFNNYIYIVLPEKSNTQTVQAGLNQVCKMENAAIQNHQIELALQPLGEITIGSNKNLVNEIGITMNIIALLVLVALSVIVIISACFNYTNLSLARSMKRFREVGIRKVVGAYRGQVISQFITESVLTSMLALFISFPLFLVLREQFLNIHPFFRDLVSLDLSMLLIGLFILFAVIVGIVAGILPAIFFSKIKALQVLKGASSLKAFRHLNMRKSLIVIQYVFSLVFITTTIIGYGQYKNFLAFDLGYNTENILNIKLQGNNAGPLIQKLTEMPTVENVSKSGIITGLGSGNTVQLKYKDPNDSASVWQNIVDEKYLQLHKYKFLAGRDFRYKPEHAEESEVIVNEKLVKRFGIGNNDPDKVIGEILTMAGKDVTIIGVLKDFNYLRVENDIQPVIIRYAANPGKYINVKISSNDLPLTMAGIQKIWKDLDNVHEFDAEFYDAQIEQAYSIYSIIIKVIGFLAFMAVFISSIGLFGMVVYTTETKLKEISIRKVFGAGDGNLIYLLSKSFFHLLILSALIALPITYLFFEKVVLVNFAYHAPIGLGELFTGLLGVLTIALIMITSQTFKAARTNPAQTLSDE